MPSQTNRRRRGKPADMLHRVFGCILETGHPLTVSDTMVNLVQAWAEHYKDVLH